MPLGKEIGLGPSDIVLDGNPAPHPRKGLGLECRPRPFRVLDRDPAPPSRKGGTPQFSAYVYCGQTAGWIKMSLGIMEVGLGPGHTVLEGDPAPPPKKGGGGCAPPTFGPCLLWPNGWMDQDTTWYGGRPRAGHNVVLDSDPAPPQGAQLPDFRPMFVVTKRLDGSRCHLLRR